MKPYDSRVMNGWTLVELMVSMFIMSLLLGLAIYGIRAVVHRAASANIRTELALLTDALEDYRLQMGSYPPDFSMDDGDSSLDETQKLAAINRHLGRAFPDRDLVNDVPADLSKLNPQTALHFWLRGFSSDPRYPLTGSGQRQPFFEFDGDRLVADRGGAYVPPLGGEAPYLYYHNDTYGKALKWGFMHDVAMPYTSDSPGLFAASKKFQIISAGMDGDYGIGGGQYPSGVGYEEGDLDNITNFSSLNLGDVVP